MQRLAQIALLAAVALAVVAFGGTEPYSFALVLLLIYAVAAATILAPRTKQSIWRAEARPYEWLAPVLLLVIPLLQWSDLLPTRDRYETTTHLLLLAAAVCVFIVTRKISSEPAGARSLLAVLFLLGGFEALYGLGQFLSNEPRIFHYVNEFARGNATGTYINRNHFASFMAMLLPLAMASVVLAEDRMRAADAAGRGWRARLTNAEMPRLVLAVALAAAMCAALLASRSRMGVLAGATAAAFAMVVLARVRADRLGLRARPWPLLTALAAGAALALAAGGEALFGRFALLPGELGAADAGRWSFWRGAAALVAGAPLTGTGLGTFALAFPPQQTSHFHLSVSHAHNDYLQLAVETGVPTAALFFGLIAVVWARCVRIAVAREHEFARRAHCGACGAGLLAMLLHALADFNFYVPANALLFAALAGLASAISTRAAQEARPG
jgi:O-antigen ligase